MKFSLIFLAIVSQTLIQSGFSATDPVKIDGFLEHRDLNALRSVFSRQVEEQKELANVFYGVSGYRLLGDSIPKALADKVCSFLNLKLNAEDLETVFFASVAGSQLDNCQIPSTGIQKLLDSSIVEDKTTEVLFQAASVAKTLKLKIDPAKFSKVLAAVVKKDDSVLSLSYAFEAASLVTGEGFDIQPYLNRIEDVVAQADEVDGRMLQFEAGLTVTAVAISGIYNLADRANKAPTVKPEECIKFANYLLSRKGVKVAKTAYQVLRALNILTENKFQIPVSISLAGPVGLSNAGEKILRVKVGDLLGESFGASIGVQIETATHLGTNGVLMSQKSLKLVANEKSQTLFEINFFEAGAKLEKGFYKVNFNVHAPQKPALIGLKGSVTVKVLTEISVENVEIAVTDREQTQTGNMIKVQYPNKVSTQLEADYHQKILMKFSLKNKQNGQTVQVHQAFVAFINEAKNAEIIFVAEVDKDNVYKFDVDLQKSAKDFGDESGKYLMKLIIGDAVINNPLAWHIADIKLKFPTVEKPAPSSVDEIFYSKRPEIQHMFRPAEKRPPQIVSDTFTILCIAPAVILLLLWLKIGVNVSNFPMSLFAIGFHLGLAAIFGLYYLFWTRLNMFETLKLLLGIGSVTFLCGNRMLQGMAEKRKTKAE